MFNLNITSEYFFCITATVFLISLTVACVLFNVTILPPCVYSYFCLYQCRVDLDSWSNVFNMFGICNLYTLIERKLCT